MSTLSSDMQRPSAEKLWQMPQAIELPIVPFAARRSTPLDVQATSYLAASVSIVSFSMTSMSFSSM